MPPIPKNKKFLTQQELAERWCISASCVKNYRVSGYLPYFQLPGSKRVLYPISEIERIETENIKYEGKEKRRREVKGRIEKETPEISSTINGYKKWRI